MEDLHRFNARHQLHTTLDPVRLHRIRTSDAKRLPTEAWMATIYNRRASSMIPSGFLNLEILGEAMIVITTPTGQIGRQVLGNVLNSILLANFRRPEAAKRVHS